jgi:hypothetical protein
VPHSSDNAIVVDSPKRSRLKSPPWSAPPSEEVSKELHHLGTSQARQSGHAPSNGSETPATPPAGVDPMSTVHLAFCAPGASRTRERPLS